MAEQAVVLYDYVGQDSTQLTIKVGDVITVVRKDPSGWGEGVMANGQRGWFPISFTKPAPQALTPTAALHSAQSAQNQVSQQAPGQQQVNRGSSQAGSASDRGRGRGRGRGGPSSGRGNTCVLCQQPSQRKCGWCWKPICFSCSNQRVELLTGPSEVCKKCASQLVQVKSQAQSEEHATQIAAAVEQDRRSQTQARR